MKIQGCILILGMVVCNACEFKRLDTAKMKQDMENQQIKHVTSSQLSTFSSEKGEELAGVLQQQPVRALRNTTFVDSLAKASASRIVFVPTQDLSKPQTDTKTKEVFAAYQYSAEKHLPQETNIQQIGDGSEWLYTVPVVMTKEIEAALVNKSISNPVIQSVPQNDLLGLWAIYLNRKELIRQIDPKKLEKKNL
ncbi:hypothetical protein [Siphonobacter sp. SORGH_AS_0500]|uniref:hypothetical protein n=1 Tax=Siphonobacter sp. SORGH_AS_0500 TaxID=1864824 RepID=UPI00285C59ED|nr:hypothetical protein [Siphonobacter sp. SORGH_AS_0500]MDR6193165.1 UDP-glucose 6-dehydrogenase [Siphonobacter sp. SORGH_AS_0500]